MRFCVYVIIHYIYYKSEYDWILEYLNMIMNIIWILAMNTAVLKLYCRCRIDWKLVVKVFKTVEFDTIIQMYLIFFF